MASATVTAIVTWTGPSHDQLTLLDIDHVEFGADWPEDSSVTLLREIDADGVVTGRLVGVEIDDFLSFDGWQDIPDCQELWQTADDAPTSLRELLHRIQARLLALHPIHASAHH